MTSYQWQRLNAIKIGEEASREYLSEITNYECPLDEVLEWEMLSKLSWEQIKKVLEADANTLLLAQKIQFKLVHRPFEIYERIK